MQLLTAFLCTVLTLHPEQPLPLLSCCTGLTICVEDLGWERMALVAIVHKSSFTKSEHLSSPDLDSPPCPRCAVVGKILEFSCPEMLIPPGIFFSRHVGFSSCLPNCGAHCLVCWLRSPTPFPVVSNELNCTADSSFPAADALSWCAVSHPIVSLQFHHRSMFPSDALLHRVQAVPITLSEPIVYAASFYYYIKLDLLYFRCA